MAQLGHRDFGRLMDRPCWPLGPHELPEAGASGGPSRPPSGHPSQAPPTSRGCTACGRQSSRLCALLAAGTGDLYEVCESCALTEELRRLAAQIPEDSITAEAIRGGLGALYQLACLDLERRG